MKSSILFVLLVVIFVNTLLVESKPKKSCRLIRKNSFYTVACEHPRKITKRHERTKKRQKFKMRVEKCEILKGEAVRKSNILSELPTLFNMKCPKAFFMQEMKMVTVLTDGDEPRLQVQSQCCAYTAVVKS